MTALEKAKVVRIRDGVVEEMFVDPSGLRNYPAQLWRRVNKNGSVPGNRHPDGYLADPKRPSYNGYVRYDAGVEAEAQKVRDEIKDILQELEVARTRLTHLYKR